MTFTGETVELHGHRGARGLRPENTLPAFRHALALGVHAIEFDVGLTQDGVVVLNHDQALSAVTARDTEPATPGDPHYPYVGKALRALTLAQVRKVDAGTRHPTQDDDPFVLTQLPVPGTRIPTLAEVCALLSTVPDVRLAVELKTDPSWPDTEVTRFTAAVAEVLQAFGLSARSRLLAFDWRVLVEARRYIPDAGRVALIERVTAVPGTPWSAGLDTVDPVAAALDVGATSLSPEMAMTTPALVEHAQSLALPVSVWTVNEPSDMTRYLSYGVNAIVTDYPDRLHTVLSDHGLPVPIPRPNLLPIPNGAPTP
ncbi:glycerophosphodiester phosphodiesterase family protein [Actinomadura sp. SCN-SB]|uniref:glycerophosphodiester phosphodiesterase family protein n=1 Tax=Actinomadura sp. SCN-SB TaxID=3373092 RepID=UPI003753AA13